MHVLIKVETKSQQQTKSYNSNASDLIQIACHFNDETLLTKNADLIQIIEVKGFIDKDSNQQNKTLRDDVRAAILKYIKDPNIAIHLHVIRDYQNIMPKAYNGSEKIVNLVENTWCKQNNWDHQLVNTLYIALIKKGPKLRLFNIADFLSSIFSYTLKQKYKKHLDRSLDELSVIIQNIKNDLSIYFSKILSIKQKENNIYSEPLSFYYYLTHFEKKEIKVEPYDYSQLLADFKISTDFNILYNSYNGKTKFAAAYSIEFKSSIDPKFLESITQCDAQFIISELITFVSNKKALKDLEHYQKTLKSVKNLEISKELYISDVINADKGEVNDYCSSQTNIILYSDNLNLLNQKIKIVSEQINNLGIKSIREDFNLQSIFYFNLPGNTYYSNRSSYLPTCFSASFSNIHSKNMGNYNGSIWGEPVTILKTLRGGYYNFNFHYNNSGHTIIVGPKGTGKTTLTHFLLSQSLKFDIKIIYIDLEGRSEKFLKALNGTTVKLEKEKESPIKIDLLDIANYDGEIEWFADLLLKICAHNDDYRSNNKEYIEKFTTLAKELINIDNYEEKIKKIEDFINSSDDLTLKTNYKKFFQSEFFSKFFQSTAAENVIFKNEKHLGIDFSAIGNCSELFRPFLGLLLAKLPKFLTGQKTIVIINHSHNIFDAYAFQKHLMGWLEKLTNNNAMLLLTQENIDDKKTHSCLSDIMPYFTSQLYLSNRMLDKEFKYTFNLSNQEFNYIKSYDMKKRRFLVKHGEDSIFAQMNLSNLNEVLNYLG